MPRRSNNIEGFGPSYSATSSLSPKRLLNAGGIWCWNGQAVVGTGARPLSLISSASMTSTGIL